MAFKAPAWLDKQLMEKIFRESENDSKIVVTNMKVALATVKGDNYMSDVYRVTMKFFRNDEKGIEDISVIVKVAPTEEALHRIATTFFETEILMLTNTLEEINKVFQGENPFNPRALYWQKEEPEFIVFDDLTPLGYRKVNRQEGLDLNHCMLAMNKLAKFHAASIAVCEKNEELKRLYYRGIFDVNRMEFSIRYRNFFKGASKTLAATIATWPELDPKYSEKVFKISEHLLSLGFDAIECKEEDFNVLTHGDYTTNNLLFKYDNSNQPVEQMIVDFQLCKYTSPAVDIMYFRSTSMSEDVYDNHSNAVLEHYHKTLCNTMQQIGCKTRPITLEKLQQDMRDRVIFELIVSIAILPLILIDIDKVKRMEDILANKQESILSLSEKYRKTLVKRLPVYDKMGLFDLKL